MIKKAIPTIYKGIQMKSRLEANVAFFFDKLNIKWQYEPKSFMLSNGTHYMPDFFLSELKTWVEAKGDEKKLRTEDYKLFCIDLKTEILIVLKHKGFFLSATAFADIKTPKDIFKEPIYIGMCSNCGKFFFCGEQGSYHCRVCHTHNGDHDIKAPLWGGDGLNYGLDRMISESLNE